MFGCKDMFFARLWKMFRLTSCWAALRDNVGFGGRYQLTRQFWPRVLGLRRRLLSGAAVPGTAG